MTIHQAGTASPSSTVAAGVLCNLYGAIQQAVLGPRSGVGIQFLQGDSERGHLAMPALACGYCHLSIPPEIFLHIEIFSAFTPRAAGEACKSASSRRPHRSEDFAYGHIAADTTWPRPPTSFLLTSWMR